MREEAGGDGQRTDRWKEQERQMGGRRQMEKGAVEGEGQGGGSREKGKSHGGSGRQIWRPQER